MHVQEDISYQLIGIKGQQVDKNQHTTVQLLDFVSVMIENKREDNFSYESAIVFDHNGILDFLEKLKPFVVED